MNTTLKCESCGDTLRYFDDVAKIDNKYYCAKCRVPVIGVVGFCDPLDDSKWWDVDDVETGDPADFGFYDEEVEE